MAMNTNTNKVKSYEDLLVWQKSIILVKDVYSLTRKFPKEEIFGLTSQLKRATVSISSNIAEGSLRVSRKDFTRFLHIAYGSAAEVQTQLKIAEILSFATKAEVKEVSNKIKEILKMLNGLIKSLKHTDNCSLKTNN